MKRKLTYKEQLRTSAWLRKKFEIMARDNFVCRKCLKDNFESQLEVHHITYKKWLKAWEYHDYFLVTLCREHHQEEHDNKNTTNPQKIKEWLIELLTPRE